MRQMFYDAEAVLVLNPITAALLEPFARRVCIVPWGIDPARFPWPADRDEVGDDTGVNGGTEDVTAGIRDGGDRETFGLSGGRGQETRADKDALSRSERRLWGGVRDSRHCPAMRTFEKALA